MSDNQNPFTGLEVGEKGQRVLERLKERFPASESLAELKLGAASESGINDLYMNLNRQLADGKLPEKTKLVIAVAVASATGNAKAAEYFAKAAQGLGRTAAETLDAISIAAVCSIFNGYYRFRDQIPADLTATYEAFRAPFNANSFMKTAVSPQEMEAICIAVSSLNNCHKCVEGHLHKGKSLGLTDEQIDEIIKAGAVAAAFANFVATLGNAAVAQGAASASQS